jgi:hypothetical protein
MLGQCEIWASIALVRRAGLVDSVARPEQPEPSSRISFEAQPSEVRFVLIVDRTASAAMERTSTSLPSPRSISALRAAALLRHRPRNHVAAPPVG